MFIQRSETFETLPAVPLPRTPNRPLLILHCQCRTISSDTTLHDFTQPFPSEHSDISRRRLRTLALEHANNVSREVVSVADLCTEVNLAARESDEPSFLVAKIEWKCWSQPVGTDIGQWDFAICWLCGLGLVLRRLMWTRAGGYVLAAQSGGTESFST